MFGKCFSYSFENAATAIDNTINLKQSPREKVREFIQRWRRASNRFKHLMSEDCHHLHHEELHIAFNKLDEKNLLQLILGVNRACIIIRK